MTFSLLAEIKSIEKHIQDVVARVAMSLSSKPFPPQAITLARIQGLLMEVRTSLEESGAPPSVPPAKPAPAPVEWGTAFRGPLPTPAAPPPGGDAGSIARAWSEEEGEAEPTPLAPSPPAATPAPAPKKRETHKDQGDESWQWDQE